MVVEMEHRSVNLGTAITAADDGTAGTPGILLVSVGGVGEPKAIYLTMVYGRASAAALLHLFESPAATGEDKATAGNMKLSVYMSLTGDGITNMKIGPITSDLYAASDGVFTCDVYDVTVDYDQV